jgi:hypothetical protein
MILYFLKSTVISVVLNLAYHFLLSHYASVKYNRAYLLFASADVPTISLNFIPDLKDYSVLIKDSTLITKASYTGLEFKKTTF